MTRQNAARVKMLGVMLVFVAPLAVAYLLYYGMSYGGAATNDGVLLDPVERLPTVQLRDAAGETTASPALFGQNWTMLQVAPEGCGSACIESLKETRQIRALLHRRSARVQRVLLVGEARDVPTFEAQPDLSVYRTSLAPLTERFEAKEAGAPGTVYLVDPLGNWMLFYPPSGDGSALFKDVKHLLKLSNIG